MKVEVLAVVGLTALSHPATALDTSQTQQMPKFKPGLNLMGDQQVDPRMEEYKKAVDREYNDALKKIPKQQKTKKDPWADIRSGKK